MLDGVSPHLITIYFFNVFYTQKKYKTLIEDSGPRAQKDLQRDYYMFIHIILAVFVPDTSWWLLSKPISLFSICDMFFN